MNFVYTEVFYMWVEEFSTNWLPMSFLFHGLWKCPFASFELWSVKLMMTSELLNTLILSALSEHSLSGCCYHVLLLVDNIVEEHGAYIFMDNVVGVKKFPSYVGRIAGNVAALTWGSGREGRALSGCGVYSHPNHFDSEDGDNMFLRNVIHLQNYMTLQLQMTESENLHLWKTCKLMCNAAFVIHTRWLYCNVSYPLRVSS